MKATQKYLDEAHRILNFFDRSIEPEVGDRGYSALSCSIKEIDAGRHAINAVLSSDHEDRYGEVVDPKGFEPHLETFNSNPQLLYCHDHKVNLGHWEKMRITKHTLEGWAVFDDGDDDAMKIFRKYERKFMRAFSVGFIAHSWEMEEVGTGKNKRRRRRFTEQEPLEGTACTVPANPVALSKAFGLAPSKVLAPNKDIDPLHEIDYAKLAAALIEGGLGDGITKQINKVLTDPCGPVDSMLREAVAAVLAEGSCGHDHGHPDPGTPAPGPKAADPELLEQLRQLTA